MRRFTTVVACLAAAATGGCGSLIPAVPLDPADGLVAGAIAGAALGAGVGAAAGGAIGYTAGAALGAAAGGAAGAGVATADPAPAQPTLSPGGGAGAPGSEVSPAAGGDGGATVPGPEWGRQEQVRQVQARLAAAGFDPGSADGRVGARTRAALRAFQEARGLAPTGEPNGATLTELGVE